MVTREQRLSQCVGKEVFDAADLAQKVALRRRRSGKRDQQAYKCDCCRKWHIGRNRP